MKSGKDNRESDCMNEIELLKSIGIFGISTKKHPTISMNIFPLFFVAFHGGGGNKGNKNVNRSNKRRGIITWACSKSLRATKEGHERKDMQGSTPKWENWILIDSEPSIVYYHFNHVQAHPDARRCLLHYLLWRLPRTRACWFGRWINSGG